MLTETLTALAAAGGTAVVGAAGSDAWEGLSSRLARWFGRGDAESESGARERLDRSAAELTAAGADRAELARAQQQSAWAARIETLLERLDGEQRDQAAAELRLLLKEAAPASDQTGLVSGNTFKGQTAFQAGDFNRQDVRFGPQP